MQPHEMMPFEVKCAILGAISMIPLSYVCVVYSLDRQQKLNFLFNQALIKVQILCLTIDLVIEKFDGCVKFLPR